MSSLRFFDSRTLFVSLTVALVGCASGGPRGLSADSGAPRRDAAADAGVDVDAAEPPDAEPPKDLGVEVDLALCEDADGDGYPRGAGCPAAMDCDDTNVAVNPGGAEVCNGLDDDCDGSIDEGFGGTVSCGVGACARTAPECADGHTDTCAPGAPGVEACNSLDDDCDGMIDEDFGTATTCGVGACLRTVSSCAGGMTGTCTPGAPSVEACNGLDDDCDGATDEALPALVCGVGACQRTVAACSGGAPQTCVPGAAGAEVCNGVDDDCDSFVDESLPALSCGVGACARSVVACTGGVTQTCTPGTAGIEVCDGIDDDCDSLVDEDLGNLVCGVGACQRTVPACSGGVTVACVAGAAGVEVCNGVDDDCDGTVDDGVCGTSAPSNDTCAGALLLTGASGTRATDTLVGATANTTDCGFSGVEVFYRVDVAVRSLIYLDTLGSSLDTSLSYRGTSCPGAAALCEDDDCSTVQDQLVAVVAAGTHYFAVHTHASYVTPGAFSLRWQVMAAAAGTNTRVTAAGTFAGATSGASGIAPTCGSGGGAENGYHWTQCPGTTHSISANTCTSAFDTLLQLQGPTGNIVCDDDGCGYPASQITAASTSGVGLFQLVVDGYSSTASGTYTLALTSL